MSTEAGTTLSISIRHLHAVERHASDSYPDECCGFLLGEPGSPSRSDRADRPAERVRRVLPARNEHRGEAAERGYLIAPETVLAARREAHRLGFEIVGYYHSHPDRPAAPSATDREDAWPGMSYLIVSVEEGRPVAARSWRLDPERGTFAEEELETVGDPARPPVLETAGEVGS